jgi:cytochrome c oxidase assembly protein subunit 11
MIENKKGNKLVIYIVLVPFLMFGFAFAVVPLYDMFCRVTGFGGTTNQAESADHVQPIDRKMTIRFNADINSKLKWKFKPDQKEMTVRIGESSLASYTAQNLTDQDLTGTAIYNVTPSKAGKYFTKVQCFCFDLQTLTSNQKVSMPVSFFVDPEIVNDDNLDDVKTITLSYTFFKSDDDDDEDEE